MGRAIPITEQFQHFLEDVKESFWGDLYGKTKLLWKEFWEEQSRRERDRYLEAKDYERVGEREHRNGFYEPHFVTIFGTLVLRIARARGRSFLPPGLKRFQRWAPEVMMLIREAFLRGISTRQVGRVVATVTQEAVSAQTVSRLARSLDRLVRAFHQAKLKDEWAYLFLDGVSAGAAAERSQASADAGRLRSEARREPATAGFSAQSGREPSRLGRLAARSVSTGLRGSEPVADRHRWLA